MVWDDGGDTDAGDIASTVLHHGLKGAAGGFSDELGGLGTAALQGLTNALPEKAKDWLREKTGVDLVDASAKDAYRDSRDRERALLKEQEEHNPGTAFFSELGGGLATAGAMPVLEAAQGAGLGARMLASGATGAAQGALYGAGNSEADTLGGVAGDALLSGGLGGAVGAALPAAGAALKKAATPVADWLEQKGINQARRVLSGGAESLSNRLPLSDEAVKQVLDQGGIRAFDTTAKAAERVSGLREATAKEYGDLIQRLEASGVDGPSAHRVASQWYHEAIDKAENSLGSPVPEMYRSTADELAGKFAPGQAIPLGRAEAMKRSLQDQARNEYNRLGGSAEVGGAKKALASDMRQAIEDAVAAQAQKAPDEAAAFVPLKEKLGNLIQADAVAEKGAARAAGRRGLSLSDNLMIAGEMAGGGPLGAVKGIGAGVANNLLRSRGTSAAAVGMYKGADLIRHLAQTNAPGLAKLLGPARAAVIAKALQTSPEEFAVTHYVLSSTDPQFSQALARAEKDPSSYEQP